MHAHSPAKTAGEAARPSLRVADLFRAHAEAYRRQHRLSRAQDRLLSDIVACRTPALGGHLQVCPQCGHEQPQYNSCRNRGCPSCQALEQARWIAAREARILPVGHHHVVFTLPSQLRPLAQRNPGTVFNLLFEAVHTTLSGLAADTLSARLGVTAVLHTWTRELLYHPHVHCVVTAGGLSLDGERWVACERYLFPVQRMKARFRARLLAGLERLRRQGKLHLPGEEDAPDPTAWASLIRSLPPGPSWVVYIEAPFGRSTHVLQYLGRYTHRIAISDHRILAMDDHHVTFRTRGEATLTLHPLEFMRRFLLHILPRGFHKIRHFGLYAPAAAQGALPRAAALLGQGDREALPSGSDPGKTWDELLTALTGKDPLLCPRCLGARMRLHPLPRGPPGRPP